MGDSTCLLRSNFYVRHYHDSDSGVVYLDVEPPVDLGQ